MAKWRVTGTRTMFGHKPGSVFEQDIPDRQADRLTGRGLIEKVRADAKTVDAEPDKQREDT